jgi:hypothetical protein
VPSTWSNPLPKRTAMVVIYPPDSAWSRAFLRGLVRLIAGV